MKFFKRRGTSGKAIDAVAEIEQFQARMEGRGRPSLEGSVRPAARGTKAFFMLVLALLGMLVATIAWKSFNSDQGDTLKPKAEHAKIENVLPGLKLKHRAPPPAADPPPTTSDAAPTVEAPIVPTVPSPYPHDVSANPTVPAPSVDPVIQRRLTSGLRTPKDDDSRNAGAGAASGTSGREADSGPMSERLQPMKLVAAQAGRLGNRDMLITQGTMIDCVQDTKLVSAQAGMITCYAPHNVRSTSGRVVLIDAGTRFVGYQQGVLAQGQPRIGVVWSRLETAKGVVIHLDSPGIGALGEAGLDGHIDTHFAERFGGAIMVSLISDFGSWASQSRKTGNSIQFDATGSAAQDAISTVLENSINIPPTLYRNQGGRIGIYVARDLDFSPVYTLRTKAR